MAHRRWVVLSGRLNQLLPLWCHQMRGHFKYSLVEIWEKTWVKCEEIDAVMVQRASVVAQHVHAPALFTQEWVRSISRTLDGAEWPSQHVSTLL